MKRLLSLLLSLATLLSVFALALPTALAVDPTEYMNFLTEGNSVKISYCDPLVSGRVVIPDTVILGGNTYAVTAIGDNAFENCGSITELVLPSSLLGIGKLAFSGCTGLTSVSMPSSIAYIGLEAFRYCDRLVSVTLSGGLTNIPESAFELCASLLEVDIPVGVTTVSRSAFAQCESLRKVTLPNTLTRIDSLAFSGCLNLTSIEIPGSVSYVGDNAFMGCIDLETATFNGNVPAYFGTNVFANCASNFTLHYAANTAGWTSPTWKTPSGETYNTVAANFEYSFDETKKYIYNVIPGSTVATMLTYLPGENSYAFFKADGVTPVTGTDAICTGYVVSITAGGVATNYAIAVTGDVNGDGKATLLDATLALRAALSIDPLTDIYLFTVAMCAAPYDGVSLLDATWILKYALS